MLIILKRKTHDECAVIFALAKKIKEYELGEKQLVRNILAYDRDVCHCGNDRFMQRENYGLRYRNGIFCNKCFELYVTNLNVTYEMDNKCACGCIAYRKIDGGDGISRCCACYKKYVPKKTTPAKKATQAKNSSLCKKLASIKTLSMKTLTLRRLVSPGLRCAIL